MTYGDKIKEIFPSTDSRLDEKTGIMLVKWVDGATKCFKADWWNAEYEEPIKALEQEPKWISVSERIPEPNRLVLCHITTGATETYFLALWNDTLNAWEEGIGGYRLLENDLGYEVIEWMPLPKFYKAESEE